MSTLTTPPSPTGRVTVLVEHVEGDVRVAVPVNAGQTVEAVLALAVSMVAASFRTYLESPTRRPERSER